MKKALSQRLVGEVDEEDNDSHETTNCSDVELGCEPFTDTNDEGKRVRKKTVWTRDYVLSIFRNMAQAKETPREPETTVVVKHFHCKYNYLYPLRCICYSLQHASRICF